MISRMYLYVRARELEGTFSPDPSVGAWIVSTMRILRGWGVPEESEWPYDGDETHWPPDEPMDIDQAAKRNRILAYQRVRTVDECRAVIASGFLLTAAFEITDQWYSAPQGEIAMATGAIVGSHTVVLTGYDDSHQRFSFLNSWGSEWGDRGFGTLPYSYFDAYQLEAWADAAPGMVRPDHSSGSVVQVNWGITDVLGSVLHCAEMLDATSDEYIAWAFIVQRKGFADVEELFVRPAYRGQGYGSRLAVMINEIAQLNGLPLRLWVSHADAGNSNEPAFQRVLERLGISLTTSGCESIQSSRE
jgi:GNAT superfamily N-acetyltransferase